MNQQDKISPEKRIQDERELKRIVVPIIENYLKSGAFTQRKLTDNPTDALQVVNRRYTNLNGTLANRPASVAATVGQHYYATDTGVPMTYNGTAWVNGVGSVVASN